MPDSYLPLAPRDLLILATLAEEPCHGYGLIKQVKARSENGITLDPANLYRVLRRMRRQDWIGELQMPTEAHDEAPAAGDRRRRIYRITAQGQAVLANEITRLEHLLSQVRPALANGAHR